MQKFLSFLIVFFSFVSLFAGWGEDLCEDVTCSGHGECQEDGEDEWCLCDEGYIADGLDCILGCDGVTCSGHGSCSVVSGAEVCTCEAGFYASGLNCILNEASTVDTLAILNSTDCYNTGNCHYRLIFATAAYSFTPSIASLYDIIVNVLDSENVWHNYRRTVAQCVTEGVCDNVDAQYIDFWFQHEVDGNQYITVEVLGNGDDASDDMYHDVLIDYCYGVDCGSGGSCDDSSGYPVCSCDYGYVLRDNYCEEGWFEDENLAAAVIELLQSKGYDIETEADIDPEMLEDITHLVLTGKGISSLTGIGLFSSLAVLDVSENNISDLSPLADCTGLKVLNISSNPANDLSPLGSLPLYSLDLSYSGVYNMNPLVSISTLKEIVLADTTNGRHGIIRPENSNVAGWLAGLNLSGCNTLSLYDMDGSRTGIIDINAGCSVHGSCVLGRCVCDEGYVHADLTNTCFNPDNCGTGFHINSNYGICISNRIPAVCDDSDPGKQFPNSYLEWNGEEYAYPSGFTNQDLCLIEENAACDIENNQSICRWECKEGYQLSGDSSKCIPFAERYFPAGAYDQLILPNISRQDVVLESVPGVPSFSPVLKAGIYYDVNKKIVAGWHLELPRVELLNRTKCRYVCATNWDQKTVYLYMPWGKEEYSIEAGKQCFDSEEQPVSCERYSSIDSVRVTYYPAPGQNLFSYIVLETTKDAYKSDQGIFGHSIDGSRDWWKITRYGDDGSVTEFKREKISEDNEETEYAKRPDYYRFMDYIPISKHITRDKKETVFKYEWERSNHYSYYRMKSATIADPLNRIIKISSSGYSGLMGKPDTEHKAIYEPLEDDIEISVGKYNSNGTPAEPLRKVVEYNFSTGFGMTAGIYMNGNLYRTDSYLVDTLNENHFTLESERVSNNSGGLTEWTIAQNGYTEIKQVKAQEYIVKTVNGNFYQYTQEEYPQQYSLSDLPDKTVTVYYLEKGGSYSNKRIVEDYFTSWLQPGKRVTCERGYADTNESCDGTDAVTEEIKYNVSGSPVYFRNADNQVTVNLYDTTSDTNAENYNFHFNADPHTYINYDQTIPNLDLDFVRVDNLRKTGTLTCSALYSLDTQDNFDQILSDYVRYGLNHSSNLCSNAANRRVTNYAWTKQGLGKPYDLQSVTYPDGKTKTFTYDYDISSFFQNVPQPSLYSNYIPNGKVWGETITGSNSQNTLQTCHAYDINYQVAAQGIGPAGSGCDYKKGFGFDSSGLLVTQDFSYDENQDHVLKNDYIYDYLGRKIVERNSAGVSTVYVYDSLDRVVFTFFGCNITDESVFGTTHSLYNFSGDDLAGADGKGVRFFDNFRDISYLNYVNLETCEYYRKYKYDAMSNLVETYFFEYWGVNSNNQIESLTNPKIIKQETEYDLIGRAVKSCQYDVAHSSDKRCIETEHDAFGNIVKKTENGEERVITYDLRNRPLTVTVDGLQTEEYSYSNAAAGGYFGYDSIRNKYENIDPLTTYKDKWGRAAKSVDPFGNNVEPHYNSTTWLTDYSKTYNGTTLTSFDAYEYDDLGRISTVKKVLFDPALNSSNSSVTSISGIAAKEVVLEKSVSYDPVTGSIVSIEDSFGNKTVKIYDNLNRVIKVENYDADNQLVSSVRTAYDATGRISAVQDWTSAKTTVTEYDYDKMGRVIATCVKTTNAIESQNCLTSSCAFDNDDVKCSYQLYNTGGQVIWSADTESGGITNLLSFLNADLIVGNETVYDYNAFGEVVKTARRMTATGRGGGYAETQLYNSDAWIATNFSYDIFGRIAEKYDDNGAKTHYTYTANNLPETETYCGSDDPNCASPREVTYTYNTLRDLVSETYEQDNVSLTVNYGRDDYGRISQKYTGNTATDVYQTFTYNNRNLLETAKSVDPTNTTSTLSEVTRTYDSFGSIKSETFDSGMVSSAISWNSSTKVMTETTTLPTGKNIVETAFSGLPKALEYDGTKLLQYNYGTGNVLSSIHKNFDANNNHSAELDYTYNDWRKVSRRKEDFTSLNAPTVADYEYTYSKGLHLIGKQENIENRRTAYQYDSYYRLRRVDYNCTYDADDPTCIEGRNNVFKCNTAESGCEDFQLDGVHNIRSSYENQTNFAWTVDGFNRLTQKSDGSNTVKYTYDSNNNMIGEDFDGNPNTPPEIVYTYDKLNRLTSVANSDYLVEYSYDPFNRRTEKTVYYADGNDTFERTHKYAYDGWDIISEEIKTLRTSDNPATTTAWQLRRYVDQGTDNHIIMDTVSCSDDGNGNCSPNEPTLQRIWFHKDERGNIIAISDGNGTIYERYRYRVYGEHEVLNADFTPKTTAAVSPFLWGGSLYEPETGLYWMRNRYYHIDMHRFINQDPIGIWGDANNLGNGFAYVAGMIIEASDPSGLVKDKSGFDVRDSKRLKLGPTGSIQSEIEDILDIIDIAFMEILGSEYEAVAAAIQEDRLGPDGKRNNSKHNDGYAIDLSSHTFKLVGNENNLDYNRMDKATWSKTLSLINKMIIQKYPHRKYSVVHENYFGFGPGTQRKNSDGYTDYDRTGSKKVLPHGHIQFNGSNKKEKKKKTEDKEKSSKGEAETEAANRIIKGTVIGLVEETECSGGGEGCGANLNVEDTPYDPYSIDKMQSFFASRILRKMLREDPEEDERPFIKYNDEGYAVFVRNPFYRQVDPIKSIIKHGHNGRGFMFVRNPFAAPPEYNPFVSTADFWFNSDFNRGNVDPYWQ